MRLDLDAKIADDANLRFDFADLAKEGYTKSEVATQWESLHEGEGGMSKNSRYE